MATTLSTDLPTTRRHRRVDGRPRRLTSAPWPLVGREREQAAIVGALAPDTEHGLMLAGPAGSGKTRLVDEIVVPTLNGIDGMRLVRVYGSTETSTTPLGALAAWVPTEALSGPAHVDLLRAAASALVDDADGHVAIIIDDAHLLDDASALVVLNLVMAGRARAVVTITTGEPAPDPIVALWKDAGAVRIDLGALEAPAIEQLLGAVLDGPVDAAAVRDINEATEGNPMLLRELTLGAIADNTLARREGVWGLTRGLTATARLARAIDDRLARLDGDARDVIERLAIAGSLEPDMLGASASASALVDLERDGVIRADFDGRRWVVELSHPLAAGVVRDRMTEARRCAVAGELADEWRRGGADPSDLVRAARWRVASGGTFDMTTVIEAARRALFELDLAGAEELARTGGTSGEVHERIAAGIVLAEIFVLTGRAAAAVELLAELEPIATDDEDRAMISMAHGSALFFGFGDHPAAIDVLRDAERGLTPSGAPADEVRATRAHLEMLAGFPHRALALAEGLLNRDLVCDADRRVFVTAALAAECALAISGRCDEAVELCARAKDVHEALGHQLALARPWIHEATMALAHCEGGRPQRAEAIAVTGYDRAIERRDRAAQAWFALVAGRAILAHGRPRTARQYFGESSALFGELGQDGPRRWGLAGVVIASALLDESTAMDEAHQSLLRLDSPFGMMESEVRRARAWHAYRSGDASRARAIAEEAMGIALDVGAARLAAIVAWDLARFGGFEAASAVLSVTADDHGDLDARLRAEIATAVRDRDADRLEVLSSASEARGLILEAAEASASSAEIRTGRASFGAARRARELQAGCEGAVTPLLAGANRAEELTERQLEVARLAAEGLPSKVIARRLYVSARTVDNNLQQAFRKLGISDRRELADHLGVAHAQVG